MVIMPSTPGCHCPAFYIQRQETNQQASPIIRQKSKCISIRWMIRQMCISLMIYDRWLRQPQMSDAFVNL